MSDLAHFFQSINYASFHEDSNSERLALKLTPSDRVLCITGSGARPLDLLLDGPAEIVAIDWNPSQSHLLELKLAVIRRLDYEHGLSFLGLRASNSRIQDYSSLRQELSDAAARFWDQRTAAISDGVFFQGRWERFLRRASWAIRRLRGRMFERLANAETVAEQHSIWREQWDNRWWRAFLRIATQRTLVKYVLRDPGLEFVPRDVCIPDYLAQRFEQASANFLFRESPWVWALVKGRIDERCPLPEHLQPENFARLRSKIDNVRVETGSLIDYLGTQAGNFDGFSVSDFASYCDRDSHDQVWNAILQHASAEARICERRFLVNYPLTPAVESAITIDRTLVERLNQEDRSVVYTFLVAAVNGS